MAGRNAAEIGDMPNEILISVLSLFGTTSLIPLSLVSHQFHQVVRRIAHQRLLEAPQSREHNIILECFHPATKFTSPYLFCEYLETVKIADSKHLNNPDYDDKLDMAFTNLYSSFLPLKPIAERQLPRTHPAGGPAPLPPIANARVDQHKDFVCQNISLDSSEQFSQLCTSVNLVKSGPKRGLFTSSHKIKESTTRIFRRWLAEQAMAETSGILWADVGNTVGLKLKVLSRMGNPRRVPSIHGTIDEDPAVGYTMVIQALIIKTTKLLLMLERSIEDESKQSGKAIVIGSIWDT